MPGPLTDDRPTDATVVSLASPETGPGTIVVARADDGHHESTLVASAPNVERARRWLGVVRRVDLVEIVVDDATCWAVVHGRSRLLPHRRRVPLTVALGLTRLGTTTTLRHRDADEDAA
jgi:hypothetical protein